MLVKRETLNYLPDVDFTDTWRPYPHHQVVDLLLETTQDLGFELLDEKHELTSNFNDLFSVFNFKSPMRNYEYQIGLRNSTAKHFALGFCSGLRVVVCSNLCFNGEFVDFNIHNNTLDLSRIGEMVTNTALSTINQSRNTIEWLDHLKTIPMDGSKLKLGIYELVAEHAIPAGKLHKLIEATQAEFKQSKKMTPYLLQAGVTRMNRTVSLNSQYMQSNKANKVIDSFCTKWFADDYHIRLAA